MSDRPVESHVQHQLRNYLLAIVGYCDLILADLPEGELRDDILEIQKAGAGAMALLSQRDGRLV